MPKKVKHIVRRKKPAVAACKKHARTGGPELRKSSLPRNSQWQHDYDYIDKLSPTEKEFLRKFNSEYYHGKVKKGDRRALHKNKRLRQDCYTRKNSINRDLMSIQDSYGKMGRLDALNDGASLEPGSSPVDECERESGEE